MKPLVLTHFTSTSCLGRGVAATLQALRERRSGLRKCTFETVDLPTYAGEVAGVDEVVLPDSLRPFDCRNNRLALLALRQDGFVNAVEDSVRRWGRRRVGVFLGTSTSGILQCEIAYRQRDPASGSRRHRLTCRRGRNRPERRARLCR